MRRLVALALILPILAACDDDPTEPDNSHVGTYTLVSVDGETVPVAIDEGDGVLTISDGTVTLNANGTFAIDIDISFTEGEQTTPEDLALTGTYTRSGNTVTFSGHDDEGFETATISGDVLTTTGGGDEVIVFERD
ncbi:MAG TPA: hypothetical protein VHG09_03125 [Longimicrobiales bacterium]|nr:hypothetical protein [Longimicrobiales bacterium]